MPPTCVLQDMRDVEPSEDGMETQSEFGDETDMDEAGSERGERGALTLP